MGILVRSGRSLHVLRSWQDGQCVRFALGYPAEHQSLFDLGRPEERKTFESLVLYRQNVGMIEQRGAIDNAAIGLASPIGRDL